MAATTVKEVDSKIERFISTDPVALEDEIISNNTGGPLELCFITEAVYGNKIVLIANTNFDTIICNPGEDVTITAAQQQAALDDGNHSDIYVYSRKGMLDSTPNAYNKIRAGVVLPKAKAKTSK
jgi:hypothetical protein